MTTLSSRRRDPALLAPDASTAAAVRWAVGHAVLAPSELNTQPWAFRAYVDHARAAARIELGLDRERLLPHLDPQAREAVLACGAALLNLRLALRGAELGSAVQLSPDPALHDLLAVVTVRGRARERAEDRPLREAIALRGTRRTPFDCEDVPTTVLDHVVAQGGYEGALVSVPTPDEADALHALDVEACGREDVRTAWAHASGVDPCVVVVGSVADDRASLMRAGAGLQRILLATTAVGITCRFVNESLRQPDLRADVGRLVGLDHPQVVLQLGYGAPDSVTPRRDVDEVLALLDVR